MFGLGRHDCYRHILRGAVSCDRAAAGVWLGLSIDKRSFVMETECGLTPGMLAFAETLAPGDGSASGNAVTQRHRVVIRDVDEDYAGDRKEAALAGGIRAVTATPLIDSTFHASGVIALYHAKPHHPSYSAAQRLDVCCRVASKVSEAFARRGTGTLSRAGRQAAEAVARLLPTCGRGVDDEAMYRTLGRHLDTLLQELPPPPA